MKSARLFLIEVADIVRRKCEEATALSSFPKSIIKLTVPTKMNKGSKVRVHKSKEVIHRPISADMDFRDS